MQGAMIWISVYPQNSYTGILTPKDDGGKKWGLCGTRMNGIRVLIKKTPELSSLVYHVGTQHDAKSMYQEVGPHQPWHKICKCHDLGLCSLQPELQEINFYCLQATQSTVLVRYTHRDSLESNLRSFLFSIF